HKISVRGKTRRLLEGAGEVMHRFPRNTGEHLKADIVRKMRFDIFAHASQGAGRQAAANACAYLHSRRRGSFECGWNNPVQSCGKVVRDQHGCLPPTMTRCECWPPRRPCSESVQRP